MHKLLITDPAGVVISTKHHAVGSILPNVPPGIAKAILHFKQGRDIGTTTNLTALSEVGGGSPQEDFTRKLKLLLVQSHDLDEDDAADLITENTHLVGLGAIGGDAALERTAFALMQAAAGPFRALPGEPLSGTTREAMQPASRFVQVPGAAPTGGGDVIVSKQPTAPLTQSTDTGGNVATPLPAAGVDPGPDQPSKLQQATADAEKAEVTAAAEAPVGGSGSSVRVDEPADLETLDRVQLLALAASRNVTVGANANRRTIITALSK